MKYNQNSPFGSHFGRHLEFQYEESTSRLGTRARKFAHCIIFNIKLSNLFSGGGGTNFFFCSTGFCTIILINSILSIQHGTTPPVWSIKTLRASAANTVTLSACPITQTIITPTFSLAFHVSDVTSKLFEMSRTGSYFFK